jgi:ADP-ribose pyrophosphatase YjhB (NUDIX family)
MSEKSNAHLQHVAGGIIKNEAGWIAVVSQLDGTFWTLPEGHVEELESTLEGALREIKEETGLTDVVFLKPLPTYSRNLTGAGGIDVPNQERVIHLFLFSTTTQNLKPHDSDIYEAKWVKTSELVNTLSHPKDKEYVKSILHMIE